MVIHVVYGFGRFIYFTLFFHVFSIVSVRVTVVHTV